jgi:hypothetical protein
VADDDRAVLDKLAALEAEMKADADAQRARKDAALAKLRAQRAAEQAERDESRKRELALVSTSKKPASEELVRAKKTRPESRIDDLGGALELAGKANEVKQELARKPGKGEKSWIKSGIASMALGPIGWLYAGSWREAVPASAAWLALLWLASHLPTLLLWPALMVALPLSGIAGVVYALQYNRNGSRQRLFGDEKKQLPAGK